MFGAPSMLITSIKEQISALMNTLALIAIRQTMAIMLFSGHGRLALTPYL